MEGLPKNGSIADVGGDAAQRWTVGRYYSLKQAQFFQLGDAWVFDEEGGDGVARKQRPVEKQHIIAVFPLEARRSVSLHTGHRLR